VSKNVLIKVTVVVYEDGGVVVSCSGNDVDCKVATYAIQVALALANKLAVVLLDVIKEKVLEEMNKQDKANTGIM